MQILSKKYIYIIFAILLLFIVGTGILFVWDPWKKDLPKRQLPISKESTPTPQNVKIINVPIPIAPESVVEPEVGNSIPKPIPAKPAVGGGGPGKPAKPKL